MNQGINQNEFENFLKENAEEHRLFASENVWKKIYQHVHLKGKIQLAILILLIVSTAITFKWQTNSTKFENRRVTSHLEEFHPTIAGWNHFFQPQQSAQALIKENSGKIQSIIPNSKPTVVDQKDLSWMKNHIAQHNFEQEQSSSIVKSEIVKSIESSVDDIRAANHSVSSIPFNRTVANIDLLINPSELNLVSESTNKPTLDESLFEKVDIPNKIKKSRKERISWQLAAMPTASFRRLSDESKSEGRVLTNFPFLSNNPEELVRHTPAIGMEIGLHMLYELNSKFRLKTGLQVNYSKYDINAFSTGQVEPVRIELDGLSSRTYYSYSNIRNFGGDKAERITNQYFQLAVPIGIEFTFLKKDHFEIAAAGTIQPNYLLNANSYLISADFKNYAQAPDLIRKFNASTSGEVFISYSTGSTRWQVGPVVRYQLKSSFIKEYPIREHIIEYGFKIAVSNIIP